MLKDMHIQCLLVLLAVGVVAGGHRSKRGTIDPRPIHTRMRLLQNHIDFTGDDTYATFQKIDKAIEKRKENCTTTLSMELQGSANAFKNKLVKEVEQAKKKGKGKDVEKVVSCVENEQERYVVEYAENYKESLICIRNATKTVKEWVKSAKNTFTEHSFVGPAHSDAMFQRWNRCRVPNKDWDCINATIKEYWRRIDITKKQATETTTKAREAVPKYNSDTEVCVNQYKRHWAELEGKHKKLLGDCLENPESQKA